MTFWAIVGAVLLALVVLTLAPYILAVIGAVLYALWWLVFGWWVNWMRKYGI